MIESKDMLALGNNDPNFDFVTMYFCGFGLQSTTVLQSSSNLILLKERFRTSLTCNIELYVQIGQLINTHFGLSNITLSYFF